jgi:two-component system alkaline phosphatase synthesis response regulator PhoP
MTKILVIEDDAAIQENLIDILDAEGFRVISADNGLVGVLMAKAEIPDLIICDVMMPELDGHGVLQQLRNNSATATIPFIFLTAKADMGDLRQGMELGADDYLTKPFTTVELLNAVNTRLEKRAAFVEQYQQEHDRAKYYQQKAQESENLLDTQEDFLKKLTIELRNPLSNINVAIKMLEKSQSKEEQERYLNILREECYREMLLLNQMTQLQELISPSNLKLLNKFQLLD